MTPQEIFDKAYIGVVKQGKASLNDTYVCAYRGLGGTKCAIGHLVDNATAKRWDNYDETNIGFVAYKARTKPDWLDTNLDLLRDIQEAHDTAVWPEGDFVDNFKIKMLWVAEDYKLTVPELSA